MEMLIRNDYILKNPDRKKLKEYGFHYNRDMSDSDGDFYSIRFPVLQYLKSTTVEGEIVVDINSGAVKLNAYSCTEVYKPIIKKINDSFIAMFKKIGIKKVGE